MQPLTFKPLLKRIRWGGRRLGERLGKPIGDGDDWAESWEVADHGADQSIVAAGEFQGQTLGELVRRMPRQLFGPGREAEQFPLLVKFLDAGDRLSVQVHPDDRLAKRHDPSENGKTEAWVILAADPGSCVYAGLKNGVDRSTLRNASEAGTVEECLHAVEVSPGDAVFIPAGTVHAIGEGILLAEIQQQSDLTFRLYDWGRTDADGNPRQLHIAEALEATDFARGPIDPVEPQPVEGSDAVESLVRCDYFEIRRHCITEATTFEPDGCFHIYLIIDGSGVLDSPGRRLELPLGSTVLLPAEREAATFSPDGRMTLLETLVP